MSMFGHELSEDPTTTWLTPPSLLRSLGEFDLDPCTPIDMPWKTAKQRYTKIDDGLVKPWEGRIWLNPPYGKELRPWMRKMARHGNGIALIFSRTETDVWFDYVWPKHDAILFILGRINFHKPDGEKARRNAGAGSALIAYGKGNAEILKQSRIPGHLITR